MFIYSYIHCANDDPSNGVEYRPLGRGGEMKVRVRAGRGGEGRGAKFSNIERTDRSGSTRKGYDNACRKCVRAHACHLRQQGSR